MTANEIFLDESVEQISQFEGTMIANEHYRQTAYDEMCILYTRIALESSLKENVVVGKKFADQIQGFYEKKLDYVKDEEKERFQTLKDIVQLILKGEASKSSLENGLKELQILDKITSSSFDIAKANYYKLLT